MTLRKRRVALADGVYKEPKGTSYVSEASIRRSPVIIDMLLLNKKTLTEVTDRASQRVSLVSGI
jgi:alanyl-tRNA synthetase